MRQTLIVRSLVTILFAAPVLLLADPQTQAAVTFSYEFGQDTYDLTPGQTQLIPLYLQEVTTDPDSSLLASEDGLFSAGVRMQRTSPIPSDPAAILTPADVVPNTTDFDDALGPVVLFDPADVSILEFRDFFGLTGTPIEDLGGGVQRILLADLGITAGALVGQTTFFTAGDFDPQTSDTITWLDSLTLDPQIAAGDVQITVVAPAATAVPEPLSLVSIVVGLAALVLGLTRRQGLAARGRSL